MRTRREWPRPKRFLNFLMVAVPDASKNTLAHVRIQSKPRPNYHKQKSFQAVNHLPLIRISSTKKSPNRSPLEHHQNNRDSNRVSGRILDPRHVWRLSLSHCIFFSRF